MVKKKTFVVRNEQEFDRANRQIMDDIKTLAANFIRDFASLSFEYVATDSQRASGHGSPVLTGRYYNSHRLSVNSKDPSTAPENPAGANTPYSPLSVKSATIDLSRFKLGDSITVSNSLDYAGAIEDGASKRKTPQGVYKVSLDEALFVYRKGGGNSFWNKSV